MDRQQSSHENQTPHGLLSSTKKGNTYRLPKPKKDRSKSGSKKKTGSPRDAPSPTTWKPLEVKRCALQTLGGSSGNPSPAPLKGDAVYKTQNNEATLRKMKLYGGSMFYDKCYLSSEDEREAEEEERFSWALSPSDAEEVPPLPRRTGALTYSKRKTGAGSSSSFRSKTITTSAGTMKRKVARSPDPFSMPPVGEDNSFDSCSDRSSDEDAASELKVQTKATMNKTKSPHPRARTTTGSIRRGGEPKNVNKVATANGTLWTENVNRTHISCKAERPIRHPSNSKCICEASSTEMMSAL